MINKKLKFALEEISTGMNLMKEVLQGKGEKNKILLSIIEGEMEGGLTYDMYAATYDLPLEEECAKLDAFIDALFNKLNINREMKVENKFNPEVEIIRGLDLVSIGLATIVDLTIMNCDETEILFKKIENIKNPFRMYGFLSWQKRFDKFKDTYIKEMHTYIV